MDIIQRQEALAAGLTHYFTGKPCKRGHISKRYVRDKACSECGRTKAREQYRSDPAKYIARRIRWRSANREKVNAYRRGHQKRKLATDPRFALELRIRGTINEALKKGGYTKKSKASDILGCTWDEFKVHIERQFLPGMSWENRYRWHIDHIVPLSKASSIEDLLALNHVSNLRPIWSKDNLAKRDHVLFLI